MSAMLLLVLFGLAFLAAVGVSRAEPTRFAFMMILFAVLVCIIYWTMLAGILYAGP
jgi:hypothetical protein